MQGQKLNDLIAVIVIAVLTLGAGIFLALTIPDEETYATPAAVPTAVTYDPATAGQVTTTGGLAGGGAGGGAAAGGFGGGGFGGAGGGFPGGGGPPAFGGPPPGFGGPAGPPPGAFGPQGGGPPRG